MAASSALQRLVWSLVIATCLLVDGYIYLYHGSTATSITQQQQQQQQQQLPSSNVASITPRSSRSKHHANSEAAPSPLRSSPSTSPPPPPLPRVSDEQPLPVQHDAEASTALAEQPDDGSLSIAALKAAAAQLGARCDAIVATAIFEGTQLLRQPEYCSDRKAHDVHRRAQHRSASSAAARCHVAFVDWQSHRVVKQHLKGEVGKNADEEEFIGCWQLLRVPAGLPYISGDANAQLARRSLARLFSAQPAAASSSSSSSLLFVDASRQLLDLKGPKLSDAKPPRSPVPPRRDRASKGRHPSTALRVVAPSVSPAPVAATTPDVAFKQRAASSSSSSSSSHYSGEVSGFGGASDAERDGGLSLSPPALRSLSCGFVTPSVYDGAAALGKGVHCEVLTLTAIFDAFDELIQPSDEALRKMSEDERGCFYAIVDRHSYDLLLLENRALVTSSTAGDGSKQHKKIGVWSLVLLDTKGGGGAMPFKSSRRNSRVPKMLAHRLFPKAHYALWIDSKLELQQPPSTLQKLFLPSGSGAVFAAYRNLRRDHIDEERDWVWRHKCAGDVDECPDLMRQWAEYEGEQSEPAWTTETVAIEGSVLLQDLRAPLHNALFCNWFNEYLRYGERDQMAMAYVLHRMGLTAKGKNASSAVRLIGHEYHYLTKPSKRPLTLVKKLGHREGSRDIEKVRQRLGGP